MGLTQTLEAPHPFIFLSIIYLATVMLPNCALDMTLDRTHSSIANDYINCMVYMVKINTD